MKIAIAITLYDKFDELKVLVDIIRKNWKNKYIITVSSNHPNAKMLMRGIDVDVFVQAQNITFHKELPYYRSAINITCRILDGMQRSCTAAHKLGAEYVMHLHTDAWPLKEEEVLTLINFMKKNRVKFAARGMGLGKARPDCPLGHLDDMFFIYDVKHIQKIGFFEYNPLEMLPDRLTIHGVMSLLVVAKVGIGNFYLYENHRNQVFWDGKKADPHFERGKPMMFDPQRGFLHIHGQSFPGELGKSLQAYYLKTYGLTKGKHIETFIEKYGMPDEKLFAKLSTLEKNLDWRLRLHGYFLGIDRFGRDFNKKTQYINMRFEDKVRYLVVNSLRVCWTELFGKNRFRTGKYYGLELYPEVSVWPRYLGEFYAKNLDQNDYPDKKMVWFTKNMRV